MIQYLDTSALVKLFLLDETGSDVMIGLMLQPARHVTSRVGLVEVASALSRMARERRLTETEADDLIGVSRRTTDLSLGLVELDEAVALEAVRCVRLHDLRASDAIHLASALQAGADVFICADRRSLAAANAEGLKCVDPTAPPDEAPER